MRKSNWRTRVVGVMAGLASMVSVQCGTNNQMTPVPSIKDTITKKLHEQDVKEEPAEIKIDFRHYPTHNPINIEAIEDDQFAPYEVYSNSLNRKERARDISILIKDKPEELRGTDLSEIIVRGKARKTWSDGTAVTRPYELTVKIEYFEGSSQNNNANQNENFNENINDNYQDSNENINGGGMNDNIPLENENDNVYNNNQNDNMPLENENDNIYVDNENFNFNQNDNAPFENENHNDNAPMNENMNGGNENTNDNEPPSREERLAPLITYATNNLERAIDDPRTREVNEGKNIRFYDVIEENGSFISFEYNELNQDDPIESENGGIRHRLASNPGNYIVAIGGAGCDETTRMGLTRVDDGITTFEYNSTQYPDVLILNPDQEPLGEGYFNVRQEGIERGESVSYGERVKATPQED